MDKLVKGRKYRISYKNKEGHLGIFNGFYEDDTKGKRVGLFNIKLFKEPFDSCYVEGDWDIQDSSETIVGKKMTAELIERLPLDAALIIKSYLIELADDFMG